MVSVTLAYEQCVGFVTLNLLLQWMSLRPMGYTKIEKNEFGEIRVLHRVHIPTLVTELQTAVIQNYSTCSKQQHMALVF
jgi:hypothetical protein